jgi:hypothetical protein
VEDLLQIRLSEAMDQRLADVTRETSSTREAVGAIADHQRRQEALDMEARFTAACPEYGKLSEFWQGQFNNALSAYVLSGKPVTLEWLVTNFRTFREELEKQGAQKTKEAFEEMASRPREVPPRVGDVAAGERQPKFSGRDAVGDAVRWACRKHGVSF